MPTWLKLWLLFAAVVCGLLLFWLAFTFVLVLAVLLLLPLWIWSLFTRRGAARGPRASVTIEVRTSRNDGAKVIEAERLAPPPDKP